MAILKTINRHAQNATQKRKKKWKAPLKIQPQQKMKAKKFHYSYMDLKNLYSLMLKQQAFIATIE
ncbi:hypothetical protein AD952_11280 [Acetobacter cerevisiae]|uniref:Uncharacterized protein n=1 Tax=Acetobacter cerevisiae TaxID=178900 RepID=A0A149USL4_9PROT|nr:hypothetical protein AD952_11280 [Acetobacter cerevisiae]